MSSSVREIPRVPGAALIGSAYEWWRRPLSVFIDAFARYGPIFRLDFPGQPVTVVGGPATRCPMRDDPVKDMHREGHFDPFINEVGLDVFALAGDKHLAARDVLKLPYSRALAAQFVPRFQAIAREHIADWLPGDRLDLFQQCARIATHAMMAMITPIELRDIEPVLTRAGGDVMHAIFRLRPRIILKHPAYLTARNRLYRAVGEAITRHKRGEFAHHELTYMIDACLQSAGDRLTEKDIRGICLYGLAGTQIYTGRVIAFMIYELLRNASFLERVRREIDPAFHGRTMDASLFRRMPCLRAAYLETLRCYPLIPGCPYWTERDTEVLGYPVPKGTYIAFVPHLAHFSADLYENPLTFDPTRALPENRACFKKPGAFAPFGTGSHACVATGMVETVVLSIVSTLLGEVDLSLEFPSRPMELGMSPLIAPRDPIHVRIQGPRARRPIEAGASALSEAADFDAPLDLVVNIWEADAAALPLHDMVVHPEGAIVTRQGERADALYILLEGTVGVWRRDGEAGEEAHVTDLRAGQAFGALGSLKRAPSAATVKARTQVKLLRVAEDELRRVVADLDLTADDLCALLYQHYVHAALKAALPSLDVAQSAARFSFQQYEPGQVIVREGDAPDAFYVLAAGHAAMLRDKRGSQAEVVTLGPGDFFGETEILGGRPQACTVEAVERVSVLSIPREGFLDLITRSPRVRDDIAPTLCNRMLADAQGHA